MTNHQQKAFTLIELLIVIGIIAILASAVIIAINPGQMFSGARDSTRQQHLNSINKAILSYIITTTGVIPDTIGITAKEVCKIDAPSCTGLVDLSFLVPDHLSSIPVDPRGGVNTNGTGYFISQTGLNVSLSAYRSETKEVSLGSCPPVFKDQRDNNYYTTVDINGQCWTAENMKYLPSVVGPAENSTSTPYYYVYDYNGTDVVAAKATTNYQTKGVLYNWTAALTACPSGWHLPTDVEQHTLDLRYATGTCDPARNGVWDCTPTGNALKTAAFGGNNVSGFSAISAGGRYTDGSFCLLTTDAGFWSSTESSSSSAWRRNLSSSNSTVYRNANNKGNGFSVRCLRD
jgi:uncharacterized protein (TIGR02145 family)/prepilin-type N-terminal cleavage/methylation domain-containing protein